MRGAVAAIGRQDRRDLGHPQLIDGGLDYHFAGKLHSRRIEVKAKNGLALEAAKPTMEISARGIEKEPSESREHGVAEIAMHCRHGPRPDAALEPIAHDKLIAVAKLLDKRVERSKIVTVVRVAYDHEPAARSCDTCA